MAVCTSYCCSVLQDKGPQQQPARMRRLPSLHGLRVRDRNAQSRARMEADARFTTTQRRSPRRLMRDRLENMDATQATHPLAACPALPDPLEIPACLPALSMCPELRKARPTRAAITASGITPRLHSLGDDGNRSPHPPPIPSGTVRSGDGGGEKGRASPYDRSVTRRLLPSLSSRALCPADPAYGVQRAFRIEFCCYNPVKIGID